MMTTAQTFPICPTELTQEQIDQYWRDGYLAFEQALAEEEIDEAKAGLRAIVDRYAFNDELSDYAPPSTTDAVMGGASFNARDCEGLFFQIERGMTPDPAQRDSLFESVRKFMGFHEAAPIFRRIYKEHARVQGVIRSLLGPVELYQSLALCKPAGGAPKRWHQDNAYFSVEDLDGIIGIWIALEEATVANGCMHFLKGGHKAGPLKHRHTTDCELEADRYDASAAVPIELKPGGILFFHGNVPHYTPPNNTQHPRTAIQFHYRTASNTVIDAKAYEKVFCEADGTPASCAAVG